MDLDFARLLALTYAHGPSVILFRVTDPRPELLIARLKTHLAALLPSLDRGAIAVIEPDRTRIRLLPIASSPSV
jgi:predicted nuclease of predicted toxin-antitoxin system